MERIMQNKKNPQVDNTKYHILSNNNASTDGDAVMVDQSEENQPQKTSIVIATLAVQEKIRYKTFVNIGND
jgi:hypothetical protein